MLLGQFFCQCKLLSAEGGAIGILAFSVNFKGALIPKHQFQLGLRIKTPHLRLMLCMKLTPLVSHTQLSRLLLFHSTKQSSSKLYFGINKKFLLLQASINWTKFNVQQFSVAVCLCMVNFKSIHEVRIV